MSRIRWYGPTLVLMITVLGVMILGPGMVRTIAWAHTDAKITYIKNGLSDNPTLRDLSDAFRKVAEAVEPSVVHIEVSSRAPHGMGRAMPFGGQDDPFHFFFRQPPRGNQQPQGDDDDQQDQDQPAQPRGDDYDKYNTPRAYGNGSGWVYDTDHIITNNHVIEGAEVITVRFHDGSERKATVVGKPDLKTDVAVLKVEGGNLHPASISADPVEQGDIAFAFGSPFAFDFSMSQGIISGKGRQLGILNKRNPRTGQTIAGYENFIQTDAAINPGNSGGPLTNVKGEVIGMNTAIATQTGAYNGLGFAIPVDMVKHAADQIISKGKVSRGYLGVYIEDLNTLKGKTFGYTGGKAVLVAGPPIADSPAEKAGLKMGDIIISVDGKEVATAEELRNMVADITVGTKVKLEVFRASDTKGPKRAVEVTIAEQPDEMVMAGRPGAAAPGAEAAPAEQIMQTLRKLGIVGVRTLTKEMAEKAEQKISSGVLVTGVRPNSIAASAGVTPGQVITEVMGVPVKTVEDLTTEINKQKAGEAMRISVVADGQEHYVFLEAPQE